MAKAKEIVGLDCEASAGDGIRLVVLARLKEMCDFSAPALDWEKIKGVHDMRVASRRLRSALRDFQPLLRGRKLERASVKLKRIADALGAVRDEDVAIKALKALMEEAPAAVAPGLKLFIEQRRAARDKARQELTNLIGEDALLKLQAEMVGALEDGIKPPRKRKGAEFDSGMSFRQTGGEIIRRSFKELENLSASLYRPLKAKPLHRMRIAAKRTRYAIELFSACWGERVLQFAEEIALMQTSLGELHDCDVWIDGLGAELRNRRAVRMNETSYEASTPALEESARHSGEAEKRRAAVWLMQYFTESRARHFSDALARWHDWETSGFHARLFKILEGEQRAVDLQSLTLSPVEAVTVDIESRETS